jgi:transcriptional regulator with XRE-family HTH domain
MRSPAVKIIFKELKIVTFAENLKRLRNKTGISQEQLAREAGLSFSSVAKYETGAVEDPSLSAATKLAAALAPHLRKTNNTVLLLLNQSKDATTNNA